MDLLPLNKFDLIPAYLAARSPVLRPGFVDLLRDLYPQLSEPARLGTLDRMLPPKGNQIASRHCLLEDDTTILGTTILTPLGDAVELNSIIAPKRRGAGLGSIFLVKTIGLAGQLGFTQARAVVAQDHVPSWKRFERLVDAGLATLDTAASDITYRHYSMPTATVPASLHAALAPRTAAL